QTVNMTISASPVTSYVDGTPVPAALTVLYTIEHRYCGATAWDVKATALTTPSSVRPLEAACHEYAFVAYDPLNNLLPSTESAVLRVDLTPKKQLAAPTNLQAK